MDFNKLSLRLLCLFLLMIGSAYADNAKLTSKLDTEFQKACQAQTFSGTVLIAIDNQIIFEKACGLANRSFNVPNRFDTKFNLASVGKLFTSIAIAQLIQQNKLNLTTSVYNILPTWLPNENQKNITVGQLLLHTSGLGSFMDDARWKLGSDSALYVAVDDYKPLLIDENLKFAPGTSQYYSNSAYLLLGAIIEAVTHMRYADYLQQNIFLPAGMKNTGIFRLDEPTPNRAEGYLSVCKEGKCRWINNNYESPFVGSPAGGAYSTVEDLFRFAVALHQNKLLNPDLTKEVLSAQIIIPSKDIAIKKLKIGNLEIPENYSAHGPVGAWNTYGLAVWHHPDLVGHTGGIAGASSFLATSPDGKYTMIYLSNIDGSGPISLYIKMRAALGLPPDIDNF